MRSWGTLVTAAFLLAAVPARADDGAPQPLNPAWTEDSGEPVPVPAPPESEEPPEPAEGPAVAAAETPEAPPAGAAADGLAIGDDDGIHFDLHGYYRARTHVVGNELYPLESNPSNRKETLRYVTQRLRLQPEVGYGAWATLHVTVDLLDSVVWGDNAGLSSTPLFASDPSLTGLLGSEVPSVYVRHAWLESRLPIGVLRVGRQPSQWGLGILTDDGEGFAGNDFGDKWAGTTYDRILFATKPISIVRAIAGMEEEDTPLILAAAWDKLVEDYLPAGRTRSAYDSGWLAGDDDDVDEWVVAAAWKQEHQQWLGDDDGITGGLYFVYRQQPSTHSDIYIIDGYVKLHLWEFFLEGEVDAIRGSTYAIPLGTQDPTTHLYPYKKADILGWLGRLGWQHGMFTVKLESGYASGDGDPSDEDFSGRALHPDVNVGLLLYKELLAERTRQAWADNQGLWSKGGVYNSWFFNTVGIVEPLEGLQFTLGILTAWADQVTDPIFEGSLGTPPDPHPNLGVELDASVRYRFYRDHMLAVVEGGWLRPDNVAFGLVDPETGRDRYGLASTDMWTLQTRLAFVF